MVFRQCCLRLFVAAITCLFAGTLHASPEIPGAAQAEPIALVGGTVHPVSGPQIDQGIVVFDQGKIIAIGKDIEVPDGARTIEVPGKHVYPGLIDAYNRLGLVEIGAVRSTLDRAETGAINPNVRAQVAVNPDSELIPVARANGVLASVSVPDGGVLSGQSVLLKLDGWTWEDMTLKAPVAMHLRWPQMVPVTAWWMEESKKEQIEERNKTLEQLRQAFADARAYWKARQATAAGGENQHPLDLRWEAMIPVLAGELPLVVEANELQQIQAAVAFAQREGVKLILFGGYDAAECAPLLKEHDVPVIIGTVHRLPRRRHEPFDAPFSLPERLRAAGIRFCFSGASSRFAASHSRNLPYHAATAAAYGLPSEDALKAMTLYPAQILDVADRVGSLEAGKDATLFVSDGDILEIPSRVEMAFIDGRAVDLSNRHKRLWKKYQERYRRTASQKND